MAAHSEAFALSSASVSKGLTRNFQLETQGGKGCSYYSPFFQEEKAGLPGEAPGVRGQASPTQEAHLGWLPYGQNLELPQNYLLPGDSRKGSFGHRQWQE